LVAVQLVVGMVGTQSMFVVVVVLAEFWKQLSILLLGPRQSTLVLVVQAQRLQAHLVLDHLLELLLEICRLLVVAVEVAEMRLLKVQVQVRRAAAAVITL
jgi:hypothetical protein